MRIGWRNSRSLRKEKGKLISTKRNKEMAFLNLLFKTHSKFLDTDDHKNEYFFIATLYFLPKPLAGLFSDAIHRCRDKK